MAIAHHIILGIDPGFADMGYGVVKQDGSTITALAHGSVSTPATMAMEKRLVALYKNLTDIITHYQPDILAIEKLFFGHNATTAITVGQARGCALLVAGQHGLTVREFTPLQIKQALTGYGHATKAQMQQMVKAILHLKTIPKPDDAADALAAAVCCSQFKTFA